MYIFLAQLTALSFWQQIQNDQDFSFSLFQQLRTLVKPKSLMELPKANQALHLQQAQSPPCFEHSAS
tara:strand:- start:270 stop:470 length:201 start_codon:yes stop_codon:yes gene_type:complete